MMIPIYRLWLHGLYGLYRPCCPLSPERPLNLITHSVVAGTSGALVRLLFTIKTPSYGYRNPHYKPKTVWQVYNGNPYTNKTVSSRWIKAQECSSTNFALSLIMISKYIWWRHQMETFSVLLVIWGGNSPVTGEFPAQRPVARSFDAFFDMRLNKRLSKQSWGWWFETPSRSLWHHCNDYSHCPLSLYILILHALQLCQWWQILVRFWTHMHDDTLTWKPFPHYWLFVGGIHQSLVDSPHKGPVMPSIDVFFILGLNNLLNTQ